MKFALIRGLKDKVVCMLELICTCVKVAKKVIYYLGGKSRIRQFNM